MLCSVWQVGAWQVGAWQVGAHDTWELAPWLEVWRWLGPTLGGLLLAVVIAKGVVHRRRYRAVHVLGASDVVAVRQSLQSVERRTAGEIVPVVFERSDAHPAAHWQAAAVAALFASALLAPWLPWHAPHWLLACQAGFGIFAAVLTTYLRDVKRMFVSEARATELAEEQAFQEFFRLRLHETAGRTGVLLFVSLFERRVIVLADIGIDRKVDAALWTGTRDAVLDGIARGSLRDGLIAGIGKVGAVLAEHFPWQAGDRNELPDRLIVQGE